MEGEEGFEGAVDLFPSGYCPKAVEPQLSGKNVYITAQYSSDGFKKAWPAFHLQ